VIHVATFTCLVMKRIIRYIDIWPEQRQHYRSYCTTDAFQDVRPASKDDLLLLVILHNILFVFIVVLDVITEATTSLVRRTGTVV